MNAMLVLGLQRLDSSLMDGFAESTESICCKGSTESVENCCNTWVE
jgi:hypothetical protein